ncbi:gamma-glutamyltransferase family protein [Lentibacillus sp. CBA3610]|uniref:gamma-glutamyltransferase family protein n=1 Tax=Lentibacillus sp. CBA3610 TaxID=2518176 RepID=UPI001594F452|nr:gamma-glutamyltransferase family protein [Lentibacillus sp. CBA3610]QKY68820.1 gamma-glutamyltransferase family protein [Lentibacillus sp. CBA3610]
MKNLNHLNYPYASPRLSTFAKNGMVATSQPLASQAGLDILRKGGNAIDAAIATAACLTVVEPTSNGIGGDAFALVWTKGKLHGLNASGRAPESISIEAVKDKGYEELPKYGWVPVTVPGVPAAWADLSREFGKLPFQEVLQPAIDYAREGFPVSPTLSRFWKKGFNMFKEKLTDDMFSEWFRTFAPDGRPPEPGEIWFSENHVRTLEKIAESNAESFYRGELAEEIAAFSEQNAGFLAAADLAAHKSEWVDPISVNYRGYDVWEIPPNGQGMVALQALNILQEFNFAEKESIDTYHKQIEAIKLAFADGQAHITDRSHMRYTTDELLNEAYARSRKELIGETAGLPEAGEPSQGGTVYLAAADSEGNMVSFIQSNYMGFGSGLVVPGTGIALQNRGHNFSMNPEHVNALEGGKRSYHTIIPGFMTHGNQPVGPFGVMGGFMQPQGHVQVVMNTVDFGLTPQAALDAPRWQWFKDKKIEVENRFPHHLAQGLSEKEHEVTIQLEPNGFGRGQIIWRDPDTGVLVGGSETRTDGGVACW